MKHLAVLVVGSLLIMAGYAIAATPTSVKYDETKIYPVTSPSDIKIFRSDPPKKYIKVGEVYLEASNYRHDVRRGGLLGGLTQPISAGFRSIGSVLTGSSETNASFENALKVEAAKMGGDAIIILLDAPMGIQGGGNVNATSYQDSSGNVYTQGNVSEVGPFGRKVQGIVIKFEA